MKNLFQYSKNTMFLLLGILLPSSILTLTTYLIITGNIDLSLPDAFSYLFVITVILLNAGSVFTLWLTFTTLPVKFYYEKLPVIAIGIVFSERYKDKSVGLLLPFISIGITFINKV